MLRTTLPQKLGPFFVHCHLCFLFKESKKNRCPFSFLMTTPQPTSPPNIPPHPSEIGVLIFSWLMKTHWVSQPKQPVGWRWSIHYKFLLQQKPGSHGPMLIPQDIPVQKETFWESRWNVERWTTNLFGKKIGYHTNQMIHAVAFLGWLYKRDLLERLLLVTSNLWGIKKVTAWEWEKFLVGDFYGTFKPSPFKGSNQKENGFFGGGFTNF